MDGDSIRESTVIHKIHNLYFLKICKYEITKTMFNIIYILPCDPDIHIMPINRTYNIDV